jgi:2OG-Fe(II) oxygenase superfamily
MLQESEKAEITKHILDRIEHTHEQRDPWPHRVIDGFFPEPFYRLLKDNYPLADQGWRALLHPENEGGARQVIYLRENEEIAIHGASKRLWADFFEIVNKRLSEALLPRYGLMAYKNDTDAEVQIIRDSTGYKISPHCDTFKHKRHKLLTLLIYFPVSDELVGYGTELYTRRFFGGFRKVKQAPFVDNTALLFQPTHKVTWHGVSEISRTIAARTSLQIFFKLRNETWSAKPASTSSR